MKLFYSILIALLLFFISLPSSSPRSLEKRIRSLEANVSNLKHEVDDLLTYFKTCNSSLNETVFHKFVNNYLQNKTYEGRSNKNSTEEQNILQKLKERVKKLLNFSKNSNIDETFRFSRSDGDCVDLKRHLVKFVNCLDFENENMQNETVVDNVEEEIAQNIDTTTQISQKEREDAAERSKVDTELSFMGHLKHPVEMIGKPQFKRPDLNKVQEQIDSAKSAAWMQVEDMETTTKTPTFQYTDDPMEFLDMPRLAMIRRKTEESNCGKVKRSKLFKGLLEPVNDPVQYEVPNEIIKGQQAEDESTIISNEVNKLATKIDLKQQMELISFHDQLGEKPRRFDFDVEPFYQLALENITKSSNKLQESSKIDDGIVLGPHKFFDFDKKKRSSKDGRVERLKQNLISEFKDHHFNADNFEKRVMKLHGDHVDRNEYKFLEETSHLNDGSTHAEEIIKPLKIASKLKSPNELKMEMELGEKFKELESYEVEIKEVSKNSNEVGNAPFYKTENINNENDIEELSP
ncbi:hypothetical protein PVAND_010139 [Polypedilum vanderplanki]|uniref:Uncharacterized protein n=1 Tax=Polypedilum vanderplanki TaxID=319348 RepID=A0A9J6CFC5_POLVA|nr:hypothetical protein PVAND_010139 [Polypedilum vanderplanki]